MMAITHCAIAATGTTLIIGSVEPSVLALAVVGSQFPDIDTTKSWIGAACWPLANWIENRYPHRSVTHSLLATIGIAIAASPLWYFYGWQLWLAMPLGHILSCCSDLFTKSGVQICWPSRDIWVCPMNPNARMSTGSKAEITILFLTVLIGVIWFNVISGGGLHQAFTTNFFKTSNTAAEIFRKYGDEKRITATVDGIINRSNKAVNEEFEVVAAEGNSFIGVNKAGKIYRIGETTSDNIRPVSVSVRQGNVIASKSRQQQIAEADADEWINSLPSNSFISGELVIDEITEVRELKDLEQFKTIEKGAIITLRYARPAEIKDAIGGLWIQDGKVAIKEL
ncbi:metal-dependent hydrolase [Microcoleus sp. N9_B4]|uniref:metal-dependent hydrolase n=1 Tax=Microcoleus sp. N9_B4 TaxID=3055386 RepID=UPI002FD5CB12